jgi:hypothetical protein
MAAPTPAVLAPTLLGVDFTCAPGRRKPIVVATGSLRGEVLQANTLRRLQTLAEFEALLAEPGPWLGGFDLPFGLPREFVASLGLGATAAEVIAELQRRCEGRRLDFRALVDAWGNARPPGQRLIHRATDRAGTPASSSPLQTRYVPVGFMYFEGLARIVASGARVPGLVRGDAQRVALEAYPARAAQALVGPRSYKNSDAAGRTAARAAIVRGLERGEGGFGLALAVPRALRRELLADAAGDALDAVLCLVQVAWAARQPRYGLPRGVDAVEGWIIGPQGVRTA